MNEKILIVDDEKLIRWSLSEAIRSWGYLPVEAVDIKTAIETFELENPVITLLDIGLPDGSGLDVLRQIKQKQSEAIIIIITANVTVEDTLSALRAGAYDFISKPIDHKDLQITIHNGIETGKLRREVKKVRLSQSKKFNFSQIVGESQNLREVTALAKKVAASEVSSVLLQGESGTGKDLIAKSIHYSSPNRSHKPYIAINCAAIPANLIESELFGYEKGAFTDAKQKKEGLFEQAEGGTLFLDEIGELKIGLQAKLLRVLEEGTFRRVGGLKDIPLNARVIAASNRNLKAESESGRFRLDLYYRLSIIQIDIPPLRERGNDIILLAEHFIEQLRSQSHSISVQKLSPEVSKIFLNYSWKGNVRELKNAVERCLILEESEVMTAKYLPSDLVLKTVISSNHSNGNLLLGDLNFLLPPNGISLEAVEKGLIHQALERSHGNVTRAAKLLHLSRDQMRYRLKKEKDIYINENHKEQ
jgi:DNA-binding NtrC family response regulator